MIDTRKEIEKLGKAYAGLVTVKASAPERAPGGRVAVTLAAVGLDEVAAGLRRAASTIDMLNAVAASGLCSAWSEVGARLSAKSRELREPDKMGVQKYRDGHARRLQKMAAEAYRNSRKMRFTAIDATAAIREREAADDAEN